MTFVTPILLMRHENPELFIRQEDKTEQSLVTTSYVFDEYFKGTFVEHFSRRRVLFLSEESIYIYITCMMTVPDESKHLVENFSEFSQCQECSSSERKHSKQ